MTTDIPQLRFFGVSAMPRWQTALAFALGLSQVEHLDRDWAFAIHLIGRKELMLARHKT